MVKHLSRTRWLRSAGASAGALGFPSPLRAAAATLQVGVGMLEAHGQGYYASDLGLFAKSGLDVELRQYQLGAIVAEAVASGDIQIGSASMFSLLAGYQHGIPFVVIAPGPMFDSSGPPSELLVVARDSPIRSPADLTGKTIGTNSVGGEEQLIISAFIDSHGGDSKTVKWLAVVPSAVVPALEAERIDAADLQEPELSAQRARIRSLGDHYTAVAPRFQEGAWFTTRDWLARNKDTARRFASVVVAAGRWAMTHQTDAAVILAKYVKFKEQRAQMRFGTRLDPALVQPLCDVAARYGMLRAMKASDILWDGT